MTGWAYSTEGFDRIVTCVEGVDTVTYAIGQGAPLVYFHGGGTFHGFEWVRELAGQFRVYCPYHPNFGESQDADFTGIGDYVSHYELLFPALGLETFHLCGASMGGHLAARYAGANPDDIDKLVLVSPAGLTSQHASMPDFSQIAPQDIAAMFVADPQWVAPFWPANPSPEWAAMRARESAAAFRSREDLSVTDGLIRSALKGFDRPAMLLWGEADQIVPLGYAKDWQQALPHAELTVIPGGSHLLLDEFPSAVGALRDFLLK
ncbi:MAG: 4,5:9,10-diseco-3-hydroxy-5,9, 17-trioxoandrosta(10),2-diene-4-oate hydrolase [Pseudomonadota bacterium]|jgi:pimeloyl-ACP methyl ester carboxylesterase